MRWSPAGRSRSLEDRRASTGGGLRLGVGGILVVLVLSLVFGRDLFTDLGPAGGQYVATADGALTPADSAREEPLVQFVSFVLDDAQATWQRLLPRAGVAYRDAKLVLFRDAVQSECGAAQSATGPFYCPLDERIYIDLGFYEDLHTRFGAPGDFAQAYVLAHEIGHHVQHLLGIDERVREARIANPRIANELSVRMELQADCYAGIWAHSTAQRDRLERGDIEEGLGAAAAVGDDRIQRRQTGRINVDAFTHGSSRQRVTWFDRGLRSGDPASCDTFAE